jgi:hypothetical protein
MNDNRARATGAARLAKGQPYIWLRNRRAISWIGIAVRHGFAPAIPGGIDDDHDIPQWCSARHCRYAVLGRR